MALSSLSPRCHKERLGTGMQLLPRGLIVQGLTPIPPRDGDPLSQRLTSFSNNKAKWTQQEILIGNPRCKLIIARISWSLTMCQGTVLNSFYVDYVILPTTTL